MKIILGARFEHSAPGMPIYVLDIDGFGYVDLVKDESQFYYVNLGKEELIKLKKLIEKELDMKSKKVVPFNKREEKDNKKAFAKTEKSVKPVAKDTNKTRRKMKKPA